MKNHFLVYIWRNLFWSFCVFIFIERSIWVLVECCIFIDCSSFLSSIPVCFFERKKLKSFKSFRRSFMQKILAFKKFEKEQTVKLYRLWLFGTAFKRRELYIVVHISPENFFLPTVDRIHQMKVCIIHIYLHVIGSKSHITLVSFPSPSWVTIAFNNITKL